MKGSGAKPYQLKNVGGVYSCTCPAWRNQSIPIETRTCKHLRKLRGDDAEVTRVGTALPQKAKAADGAEGPPVLLAESWDNATDLAGWWMSEKLDGVRAYWDGRQFLSRLGNHYHAPDWFVAGLPSVPLDGELWLARKAFQRTVGIVRRQDKPDIWKEVRFLVFDAPQAGGPFEARLKYLDDGFRTWKPEFASILEHIVCRGTNHLREELTRVEKLGGEGLMLRQPGSEYVAGRSSTLLKVKSFLDAEAVVIAHESGKGKHTGKLGAVTARLPDGKVFNVGTGFTDRERADPPSIGSTIAFRYQELSDGGIPRFPTFVAVRTDVKLPPASPDDIEPVPVSKPSPPIGSTTMAATKKRYFESTEDGASKFWEVWMEADTVSTRWGKIGSDGQTKTKEFADAAKAKKEYEKLLKEKTDKGYVEGTAPAE